MATVANFLPGPVSISREVRQVFGEMPVSHRADSFVQDCQRVKRLLCKLAGARHVEIFLGSGTLANDVIAGQLSLKLSRGLILSNGEFGDRLIDHASRFGLSFEVLRVDWGEAFDRDDLMRLLDRHPETRWVWATHCETSTGALNDALMLKDVCAERDVRLCLDCISSIGTVPVDLRGVYFASGVSGKGLGAFPGLSMVFYNHTVTPAPKLLPRYLDLGFYAAHEGIPFTHSSNLLYALHAAVKRLQPKARFKELAELSAWLRLRIREVGGMLVAPDVHAAPAVITIALPEAANAETVGRRLEEAGYLLSYKSEYLLKRNWIQICLMGDCTRQEIAPLLDKLEGFSQSGHQAGSQVSTSGRTKT